ncbi:RapH N-terminal domain-containing protein [Bacillus sp. JCM 19041]|uniref:response regulator aspartate phosphatase n=1 Tax=Bacillus sp. JCM 19041 TaxID=1460637 RepID=UPI0006D204A2
MSMSLAPIEVGAKIMEWYSCIVSRDLEQAKRLKGEVEPMLERMQADDKMVSYFLLVNLRYDMLVESLQKLEQMCRTSVI